ncbi:hypothetical protein D3C87_1656980 [compost metagenome]
MLRGGSYQARHDLFHDAISLDVVHDEHQRLLASEYFGKRGQAFSLKLFRNYERLSLWNPG